MKSWNDFGQISTISRRTDGVMKGDMFSLSLRTSVSHFHHEIDFRACDLYTLSVSHVVRKADTNRLTYSFLIKHKFGSKLIEMILDKEKMDKTVSFITTKSTCAEF